MASFRIFSQGDILNFVNKREGETKLGERVQTIEQLLDLEKSAAKFVLLGIPEDIGVRANYGIGGAQTAWKPALKTFLNLQQNQFLKGEDVLVLGEFNIPENNSTDVEVLRTAVADMDNLVYPIIQAIVSAGKVPIVIGGGHNNCYPIIKGTSLALNEKVNVLNIDAHTDLRNTEEGRHSGNGFSNAIKDGYLNQYRIFGLHQNYVSKAQLNYIANNNAIKAFYFDDLLKDRTDILTEAEKLLKGVKSPLGLEIDLDGICNTLASATTPSGFSLNEVRQLVLSLNKDFTYLHICEGAYQLNDGRKDETIGKTIAYLISDFIKSFSFSR
ncbi:MAG: arginase [Flavobacteriales bacterium]|nr:MAG: arginase [Flavobacteriales bacterium]